MSDLIAAELLKLRTTRTFWWVSLLAVGLPVLFTIITLATSTTRTDSDARSVLSNIGVAGLFMMILGTLCRARGERSVVLRRVAAAGSRVHEDGADERAYV